MDEKITKVKDNISETSTNVLSTREKLIEFQDKERRINNVNVIVYNMFESKEETKINQVDDDFIAMRELMENVLKVGYDDADIINITRLGVKSDSRKRPMLVEFSCARVKNLVMQYASRLGGTKGDFKGVVISHDMTKSEREQCKKQVEEAKQRQSQESGNWIYRVRGSPDQMKVIKFQKQ